MPPAAPQQKKSGVGKVLGIIAVVILAICGAGVVLVLKFGLAEEDKAAEAKVGDCIGAMPDLAEGEEKEANAEVVKCDDAAAQYTVVGRVDNLTEAKAKEDTVCDAFKEAESIYYSVSGGYVLCLKPVAK